MKALWRWSEYQTRVMRSSERRVLAVAGEQGGKSLVGAYWLKGEIKKHLGKHYNYLVVAPTYRIMVQATQPTFLKAVHNFNGVLNKVEGWYPLTDGGRVYFRSASDPDNSIIGVMDCKGAWIDEAGKCPRSAYYATLSRVGRLEGRVLLTTTPYANNYIKRELIDPFEKGEKDILYVRWRSCDNPTYPKEEYERQRAILPARVFKMRLEGLHDKAEGLVFEDFSEERNLIDQKLVDLSGAKFVGGVDWGFRHPFALVVRAVKEGKTYTVAVFKETGLSSEMQLDVIEQKHKTWNCRWHCGPDRPEMIDALNRRGVPAVKSYEYHPNYRDVNAGNQKHAEWIKGGRYLILRGISQMDDLIEEYETYRWKEQKMDEDLMKEKVVDENDDLLSAERYATIGCINYLQDKFKAPKIPIDKVLIDKWKPNRASKSWDHY